jgi:hypothetical protein
VVLSVKAAEETGGPGFTDRLTQIAVLGILVLVLGGTAWLMRLKEREPGEGDRSAQPAADRVSAGG